MVGVDLWLVEHRVYNFFCPSDIKSEKMGDIFCCHQYDDEETEKVLKQTNISTSPVRIIPQIIKDDDTTIPQIIKDDIPQIKDDTTRILSPTKREWDFCEEKVPV